MSFPRRFLLAALPATLSACVLSRLGPGVSGLDAGTRRLLLALGVSGLDAGTRRLLLALGDPSKALAIGEACLRVIGEGSARALLSEANANELPARIRDDFARGKIIVADGWVLSATEARLYALAALTS